MISCRDASRPTDFPEYGAELYAKNLQRGDPYRGYFPLKKALSGLPAAAHTWAAFSTSEGSFECELWTDAAPITSANFIGLARGLRPYWDEQQNAWVTTKLYQNMDWHRAGSGEFIQSGRHANQRDVGYFLPDEFSPGARFDGPGVLAMANQSRKNSASSEFFITTTAMPDWDGNYTIFGQCSDIRTILRIANAVAYGRSAKLKGVEIHRN